MRRTIAICQNCEPIIKDLQRDLADSEARAREALQAAVERGADLARYRVALEVARPKCCCTFSHNIVSECRCGAAYQNKKIDEALGKERT